MPSQTADSTAAAKMPVPAADSQLNWNSASSAFTSCPGFGSGTTGGDRLMRSCKPGTGNLNALTSLSQPLTCRSPQRNTNTDSSSHGIQALATCHGEWPAALTAGGAVVSCSNCHDAVGCQKRRKIANAARDASPPATSTSAGPT